MGTIDAACEAVEGWRLLCRILSMPTFVGILRWSADDAPGWCIQLHGRDHYGDTLLAALRAADAAKTKQEKN